MKVQGLMIYNDYFAFSLKLMYINGQAWTEAFLGSRLFSRMMELKSPKFCQINIISIAKGLKLHWFSAKWLASSSALIRK